MDGCIRLFCGPDKYVDEMLAARPEKKPEVHASILPTWSFSFGIPMISAKTADMNSVGRMASRLNPLGPQQGREADRRPAQASNVRTRILTLI